MNIDKFSALQLKQKILELEQKITTLRAEYRAVQGDITSNFLVDQEDIFSLRQIITLMPGNVFWKNRDGFYLGCNNNLAEILRLSSPQEIVGKRNSDLMPPELTAEIDKIDEEVINSIEGKQYEELGYNINNEPVIYFTHKLPLRDNQNNVVGLLGISIDISERKRIEKELNIAKEKAETSNRAKSKFIAVVNHELRTPLTGIIGLINILKNSDLSSNEAKSAMTDLDSCAQYLHTMVNNVLEFTKLEAGKVKPKRNPVNLESLVLEVFNILSALAKNKGIDLCINKSKNIPFILTDSKLINQILINLIGNAIKFTDSGSIVVHIRCKNQNGSKATIELAVQDTGLGIPHDKLDQIFEPFQQLEDTYVRQTSISGTGLGLSIVRRLATLLNTEIHVMSEFGKGSTFAVVGEFDIVQENEIMDANEDEISSLTQQHVPLGIKVLLVEDDKIVQYIHKNMLVELGCDVEIAATGNDALESLTNHDIAFIDIGLSDITGFELIKTMRSNKKYPSHLPIIALTGYTGEIEKADCIASGANEVAEKPVSIKQLEDILMRYLSDKT